MKTEIMRKVLAGLTVTAIFGILVACGKNAEETAVEATEAVSEVAEVAGDVKEAAAGAEETMMSLEEQIQAVQDTLVYMGGLKTGDDAAKDIEIAMFRNDQGDIIYIYVEDGQLDYGMWTTEESQTTDGKTYSKVNGASKEWGYYFNEDLVTGIIVDADQTVFDAVELDEKVARDFVNQTLGG